MKFLVVNLIQAQPSMEAPGGHGWFHKGISTVPAWYVLEMGACVTGQQIKTYLGRAGSSFGFLCRALEVGGC